MAKIELHIPVEEYGFVGVTYEGTEGAEASSLYREFKEAFKPQVGLTTKEFNACVDEMLNTGTVKEGTELWQRMNEKQRFFFQEHKKGINRLEAKNK